MPCRDYLSQLREAEPEIRAGGAKVIAVATGAHYQAAQLMESGVPFECLVDPEKQLYRELGIERIRPSQYLRPTTWRNYLRAARRARQGRMAGDPQQAPGVVILDADGVVRFLHRGRTLGDYPPVADVVRAVQALTP